MKVKIFFIMLVFSLLTYQSYSFTSVSSINECVDSNNKGCFRIDDARLDVMAYDNSAGENFPEHWFRFNNHVHGRTPEIDYNAHYGREPCFQNLTDVAKLYIDFGYDIYTQTNHRHVEDTELLIEDDTFYSRSRLYNPGNNIDGVHFFNSEEVGKGPQGDRNHVSGLYMPSAVGTYTGIGSASVADHIEKVKEKAGEQVAIINHPKGNGMDSQDLWARFLDPYDSTPDIRQCKYTEMNSDDARRRWAQSLTGIVDENGTWYSNSKRRFWGFFSDDSHIINPTDGEFPADKSYNDNTNCSSGTKELPSQVGWNSTVVYISGVADPKDLDGGSYNSNAQPFRDALADGKSYMTKGLILTNLSFDTDNNVFTITSPHASKISFYRGPKTRTEVCGASNCNPVDDSTGWSKVLLYEVTYSDGNPCTYQDVGNLTASYDLDNTGDDYVFAVVTSALYSGSFAMTQAYNRDDEDIDLD